jgi:Flp pilus assembly protein CpaB
VLRARDAGRAARLALKAKQAAKARSEPFGAAAGLLAGKPRRAAVRLAIAKHPTFLKGGRGGESVGVLPPLVTSTLFI